jgi:hypothetical protein
VLTCRSRIACPAGWHFSEGDSNGPEKEALVYFVSRERLSAKRVQFHTGLTLRVYRDIHASLGTWSLHHGCVSRELTTAAGQSPFSFARECMQMVDHSPRRTVLSRWGRSEEVKVAQMPSEDWRGFESMGVEYREVGFDRTDPQPIRVRLTYFINRSTQALYEVVFESPEKVGVPDHITLPLCCSPCWLCSLLQEWEEAWRNYGEAMLSHLYINPQL